MRIEIRGKEAEKKVAPQEVVFRELFYNSTVTWDQLPKGGWDLRRFWHRAQQTAIIERALLEGWYRGVSRGIRINLPADLNQIDLKAFLNLVYTPADRGHIHPVPYELPMIKPIGLNGRGELQAGTGFNLLIPNPATYETVYGFTHQGLPSAIFHVLRMPDSSEMEVAIMSPETTELTFTTDYRSLQPKSDE